MLLDDRLKATHELSSLWTGLPEPNVLHAVNRDEDFSMTPNDSLSWKRAAALASGWVAALTAVGVGLSMLVGWFSFQNPTNPIAGWSYLGLGPLILLTSLMAPTLAGRVHRSSRVATLVGAFSIVGLLLVLLVWTSPIVTILRHGP